jgi:hypothetical protein
MGGWSRISRVKFDQLYRHAGRSGIHLSARVSTVACAEPWTPEQVRGDGLILRRRTRLRGSALPRAMDIIAILRKKLAVIRGNFFAGCYVEFWPDFPGLFQ